MSGNIGRPRDKNVEERVFTAALPLYAQYGWAGFSLDKVAKRANVGKGSLYLRWHNKAHLLIELAHSRTYFIADIDTGSVRNDLIEFAHRWLSYMETDEGLLTYRLVIDARFYPELREAMHRQPYREYVKNTRAIIHRGIERGELPVDTSVALVADLVAGAVSNHVRNTPEHLRDRFADTLDAYITDIVDTVMRGVGAYDVDIGSAV